MSYPPQHQPMPAGASGASLCGAYSAFVVFNNSGSGYAPDLATTLCVVQVQAGGVDVPNAQYNLLWRTGPTSRGCAAEVSGSTTQKSFASSPAKKYSLTLYFTPGNSPPAGTDVVLEVSFQ
jgi:hypothetical protein